jgi:hypothetical protein
MVRSRSSVFVLALPALLPLLLMAAACGSSPEQQQLQKYFQASRLRDNATLANIATVSFSPTEHGTVQSFDVVNAGPEERRPLKLKELATAEEDARKADEEFNKKKKEYQDANRMAIERVLKAERANASLRGADADVQKAWTEWRDNTQHHAKTLADARKALTAERSLAEASVYDARNPVDATKYDGELITKDLTVRARVRMPDGAVQDKDLHIRLTRADLINGPEPRGTVNGRWIITQIGEAPPGGGAPTSN